MFGRWEWLSRKHRCDELRTPARAELRNVSDKAEEGQRQGDGKDRIDETETEGWAKD